MAKLPAKEEMLQYKYNVPATNWMNTPVDFKPGTFAMVPRARTFRL